ncbi:MAG: hypothetical protein HKN17_11625, partial [Rhodothermales bacterium]|nr:hypothetical protein [Rhodothermales bacterium]
MRFSNATILALAAAAVLLAARPTDGWAQSSLLLPADDPAYAHLAALSMRGAHSEGAALDVLPWSNGGIGAFAASAPDGTLSRLADDLLRAAGPRRPDDATEGSSVVGFRLRTGLRAASQKRLDLIRLQPERDVGLYPFVHLEPFLEAGNWSAVLGARHDVYYDQDPDAFDTALRLMVRMENAYVRYDGPLFGAMVGRTHRHWGLYDRPGLILSSNPRPMDQIAFRIGPDRVHVRTVLSELDSITADGRFTGTAGADSVAVGSERRFLAAHHLSFRVSPALSFRLSHATLYSGAGSGISLKYLNPMNVAIFETDNLPKNDENNGFVAASMLYAGHGLLVHLEGALDDFDLASREEPSSLSATGFVSFADLLPDTDVSAGITVVTSRAYNAPQPEGTYLYLGRGIGTEWSDYVHMQLEARWYGLLQARGLIVSP